MVRMVSGCFNKERQPPWLSAIALTAAELHAILSLSAPAFVILLGGETAFTCQITALVSIILFMIRAPICSDFGYREASTITVRIRSTVN